MGIKVKGISSRTLKKVKVDCKPATCEILRYSGESIMKLHAPTIIALTNLFPLNFPCSFPIKQAFANVCPILALSLPVCPKCWSKLNEMQSPSALQHPFLCTQPSRVSLVSFVHCGSSNYIWKDASQVMLSNSGKTLIGYLNCSFIITFKSYAKSF